MTAASTDQAMVGAWDAQLTFVDGPREGEDEPVLITFLPDGVVIHADRIPVDSGQVPRGIGEWVADDEYFSYWFNVVLNQRSGRPEQFVYVHGRGMLSADGKMFGAIGGSEVYSSHGDLLATNRAEVLATRAEAR